MKEGCKLSCAKMLPFDELLGNQYLFEIFHTSLSVKTAEMQHKEDDLKSFCYGEYQFP